MIEPTALSVKEKIQKRIMAVKTLFTEHYIYHLLIPFWIIFCHEKTICKS